jgi:hypothetical protein
MKFRAACVVVGFFLISSLVPLILAQTTAEAASALPRLVRFGGTVKDLNGNPLTGVVGITFALYSEQTGGAALWLETQNVTADTNGHYVALLGSTKPDGLPTELFTSEQARWVGVQVSGQAEQARVLLVSAPYALKAGDAETIGGLPPSAFLLANGPRGAAESAEPASAATASYASKKSAPPANPDVTGVGTVDYIPLWNTTSDIVDSVMFQKSSEIGINTTTPAALLDVNGKADIRDTLTLFPKSTDNTLAVNGTAFAISSMGKVNFISGQTFPGAGTITGITTAGGSGLSGGGTSGTLSLKVPSAGITNAMLANSKITLNASTAGGLTVPGAMTLGNTYPIGLKTCSANQILQYVGTAWTCSSAGTGTITGITTASGSGLAGGGASGTLSLSVPAAGITNTMLQDSSLTVSAGTDLTGGGSVALGSTVSLNLDTTKVPLLAAANTFTGNQTVNGNLSATGVVTGSSYQIGSNLFAFGSVANFNAFLGFAGGTDATGGYNTGSGYAALQSISTGSENTAVGYAALQGNSAAAGNTAIGFEALNVNSGSFNTANGVQAMFSNSTGYQNTASGVAALQSNTTGFYNTATGYGALRYNYTASSNTAHGYGALTSNTTGSPNDAFGFEALFSNTVGIYNVGLGYQALYSNVGDSFGDGGLNTAVGSQALYMNNDTSGFGGAASANVAVGYQALYSNTSGNSNAALGTQALFTNSYGSANAGFGANALFSNTGGYQNAGFGGGALGSNTTGADNTAVGFDALINNTTGSVLTCVGYECTVDADGLSNATAIGAHASVGASNSLVLGGTGKWAVKVGIGTTTPSNILTIAQGAGHPLSDGWDTFSSRRWKTNIQTLHGALAKVELLRGVSYDLKANGKHEVGVIAEEVGPVVPEVVSYEENGKDARGVDYSRLTALLIEATKEQQRQFRQQQAELAKALRQIKQQQTLLRAQSSALRSLEAEVRQARQTLQKVKVQIAAQPALLAAK